MASNACRPSGLRREDQSTSIPSYSIDYWINFASFTLFLIGSCASITVVASNTAHDCYGRYPKGNVTLPNIALLPNIDSTGHSRRNTKPSTLSRFFVCNKMFCCHLFFFEVTLIVSFIFVPYDHIVIAWSVFSAAYSAALAIAFLYANARFWSVMGKVVLQTATSSDELSTTDNQSQSQAVDERGQSTAPGNAFRFPGSIPQCSY